MISKCIIYIYIYLKNTAPRDSKIVPIRHMSALLPSGLGRQMNGRSIGLSLHRDLIGGIPSPLKNISQLG